MLPDVRPPPNARDIAKAGRRIAIGKALIRTISPGDPTRGVLEPAGRRPELARQAAWTRVQGKKAFHANHITFMAGSSARRSP